MKEKGFDVDVVSRVIKAYGGVKEAQKRLGFGTTMTVYNWKQRGLPMGKLAYIHLHTDIPVKDLLKGVKNAPAP